MLVKMEGVSFLHMRNSLCFDLSRIWVEGGPRPSRVDFVEFLKGQVLITHQDISDIQWHTLGHFVFIKFREEHKFLEILSKLMDGIFWPKMSRNVYGWDCSAQWLTLKVLNVSPETTDEEVAEVMSQFGRVLYAKRGLLEIMGPGVTDGTVTIRIALNHGYPPPFIYLPASELKDAEVWQLSGEES